jgi:hypothetical protein
MPRTKEDIAAYQKKWREEHIDELKAYEKRKYLKNKETILERSRQWTLEHKEERKAYNQTDARKKSNRISEWKTKLGILSDDYDALYERFINTEKCEMCDCEMVFGNCRNGRTLDHCHKTGQVRNVLCRECNSRRK